jgi:antitoxin HigA-1
VKLRVFVPLPTGQAGLWLNFRAPCFATKTLRHKESSALREPSFNRGTKCELVKIARSIFQKMKKLKNVHPGKILKLDFLDAMNISATALAKAIAVDQARISQLIKGSRSVSADTALRLGRFFNVSPEFWLNIQTRFDLEEEKEKNTKYKQIKPLEIA